jgi:hypothetical protein
MCHQHDAYRDLVSNGRNWFEPLLPLNPSATQCQTYRIKAAAVAVLVADLVAVLVAFPVLATQLLATHMLSCRTYDYSVA